MSNKEEQITPHFNTKELKCKCCGSLVVDVAFLQKLERLRELCGFPFVVTSYYRCAQHPEEAKKAKPGWHNKGLAVDIYCQEGSKKYKLLKEAIKLGFNGIGVGSSFIHLDTRDTPTMWGY